MRMTRAERRAEFVYEAAFMEWFKTGQYIQSHSETARRAFLAGHQAGWRARGKRAAALVKRYCVCGLNESCRWCQLATVIAQEDGE
jgi:uncharacterized Ntn-hydrolase superfamily protein